MSIPIRIDSTLRPICFGIDKKVSNETGVKVGPELFKKYEHALYIGAQISRLVYMDTGVMRYAIETSFGMSNDVVNKVIDVYYDRYSDKLTVPIYSQQGNNTGRPMESYSLKVASPRDVKYGTYISTPDDLTCIFLNANKLIKNENSIFKKDDLFIAFKGSSSLNNFKHDILAQFTPSDITPMLKKIGITMEETGNKVTGAFVTPIIDGWSAFNKALTDHIKSESRLFLCGHSLGGAYCTLFGFILAEGKASGTLPIMKKVKSIHILTYGAPAVFGDKARNTFNRHLESGTVTVDRVVSQKVPARSASTQLLVGGLVGPNDLIPMLPVGFSHPGFRPLSTDFYPEVNGRPYSIDNIRKFYGINSRTRYRDPATWPFPESIFLGDASHAAKLKDIVEDITKLKLSPEESTYSNKKQNTQKGGAFFQPEKTKYELTTKNFIPNFISVKGSVYAYGFAHNEYLGMFFKGSLRTYGRKNPAKNSIAYFELCPSGMRIKYIPLKSNVTQKTRTNRSTKTRRNKHS